MEFFCGSLNEMQISSCLSESQQLEGAGPINTDSSEQRTLLANTRIRLRVEERRIHTRWVSVVKFLSNVSIRGSTRASKALLEAEAPGNGGRGIKAIQTDR